MMKTLARCIAAFLCLASVAPAYYHFVHFASRNAPFRPIVQKFDLNVLPNKTLTYFTSDAFNVLLAPGDSNQALLSQVRAAAGAWNDVDTSDLRLAWGGTGTGVLQSTPSLDVVFDEVPPGVLAMGGPTVSAASNGLFIPILKSVVRIQPDLSRYPSYSERLFTTLVHEFGHALGLQHTHTSSVMSTYYTRSTSKARPLSADDAAAISILYPKFNFSLTTGSVSGRVTLNGTGVNLASVVAVASNGVAISTLTNPDGTWQIDGLPPRSYYLYVHPLPPAQPEEVNPGGIVYPVDNTNRTFPVGVPFETVFYSSTGGATPSNGVKDLSLASLVPATPGLVTQNVNFAVRQRTGYAINTVESYAFPGNLAVKPPYISPGMANPFLVVTGNNMFTATGPVAGLRATVLGGADLRVRPYAPAATYYAQLDFDPQTLAIPSNSARHLIFTANNDICVVPAAFYHVDRQPPQILGVTPGLDPVTRTVVLTGFNLTPDTRILFDGVTAQVRSYEELAINQGRITVAVPSAPPSYRAVITALNPDGQSSLFVQSDNPPSYQWPTDPAPATLGAAIVSPSNLSAGVEAMLQIDTLSTQFVEGQVTATFGTGDVVVRRLWVVSPTRLLMNVVVAPGALTSNLNLTIASGLNTLTQNLALQVQSTPAFRSFWLSSVVTNFGVAGAPLNPGSIAAITVGASPITLATTNAVVVLNDTIRVPVGAVNGNQVLFVLPSTLPPGVTTARIEALTDRSLPIAFVVEPTPRPAAVDFFSEVISEER